MRDRKKHIVGRACCRISCFCEYYELAAVPLAHIWHGQQAHRIRAPRLSSCFNYHFRHRRNMLVSRLNLDPGETILLEVRRHWFVFLTRNIVLVVAPFVPLVAFFVPFIRASIISPLGIFFYSLWFLLFWVFFFVKWTNYYLDVWFVTETRIIDVEQKSLFDREVSNLRFDRIQDISVEVHGVIATFLNFGDLHIKTAAEDSGFFMEDAAHPEAVREVIFSRHNREAEKMHQSPPAPVSAQSAADESVPESGL